MCSFSEVRSKVARFFLSSQNQVTLWRGVFKSCQIYETHLPSNIFKKVCSKRCVQSGVLKTPLEMLFQTFSQIMTGNNAADQ